MKKSIAFLGALLFGSVTFGQVTKNDSINKSTSRKVSAEDMKKFPEDIESTTNADAIKGESKHKSDNSASMHKGGTYKNSSMQKSSDASAGKGESLEKHRGEEKTPLIYKGGFRDSSLQKTSDESAGISSEVKGTVTQKGKVDQSAATTEKQHYTIKLTNANKKAAEDATGQVLNDESATSMMKKHISNIKWTPGKATKDSTKLKNPASSEQFMKITDEKPKK